MKKWEICVLIGFFAIFVILFFSFESPWQPKTSKVGEPIIIDDVHFSVDSISADDHLNIYFMANRTIDKEYEAGAGWKFVILDMSIYVSKDAKGARTLSTGRIEDENGMTYDYYSLLEHIFESYIPEGTPYLGYHQYEDYINLLPSERKYISVAYKIPTNAVPEKFYYFIYNSHSRHGEVILKR